MHNTDNIKISSNRKLEAMVIMALAMNGKKFVQQTSQGFKVKILGADILLNDEDFKKCIKLAKEVNQKALEDLAKLERKTLKNRSKSK